MELNIGNLGNLWDDICNLIIRPQRSKYNPRESLGPKLFTLGNKIYEREDISINNSRGMELKCSYFKPIKSQRIAKNLPCVIYCHGNCGCRVDALDAVQVLLPLNITVFCFDFSGSGLSGGKYVSLGYYEQQDVKSVVDWLSKNENISKFGLWGRSMGAATSLMYGSGDKKISAIVADSPFKSLEEIIKDLVLNFRTWVPNAAIKIATNALRRSIQTKAKFDIKKNAPIEHVKKSKAPVLFAHAEGDNFIKMKHSENLYEIYGGDKNLITFDGDHNSRRPDFFYDTVSIFFYNILIANDKSLIPSKKKVTPTMVEIKKPKEKDVKPRELPKTPRGKQINMEAIQPRKASKHEMAQLRQACIESTRIALKNAKTPKEKKELKARLEYLKDENNPLN